MRACAVTLLAAAGFGLAASSHAFGSPAQTEPEPTTTAPPPDPAPTTVPRPDPAPPPPPPRPSPQPQPAPPPPASPTPPSSPPPPALSASPPPVAPVRPLSAPKPSRADLRQAPRRRSRPAPLQPAREERVALTPKMAALRIGERIRGFDEDALRPVAAGFVEVPAAAALRDAPTAPFVPSLAILAALGLGTLLLAFSAVPDAILVRGPRGVSFVRARVEVGLIGGAIVAIVAAVYFVGAAS